MGRFSSSTIGSIQAQVGKNAAGVFIPPPSAVRACGAPVRTRKPPVVPEGPACHIGQWMHCSSPWKHISCIDPIAVRSLLDRSNIQVSRVNVKEFLNRSKLVATCHRNRGSGYDG
jgi:hypothetical protein